MILQLFLSLFAIFLLLVSTEILWRTRTLHIETSRKIVHIGTGVIVAFWPYFLSWNLIQAASILLIIVIFISYRFNIFKSIHSIDRLTVGEILYPVGILVCALLEPAPWVFSVAILHLTLADGLAALIGIRYGSRTSYTLMSHGKSIVGSATFFVTSLTLFIGAAILTPDNALPLTLGWFIILASVLTIIENVSWYGLDDITVPVSTIVLLTILTT